MHLLQKQLSKDSKNRKLFILFIIATASALVSSMAFFVGSFFFYSSPASTVGNIIQGIEFWAFLAIEIVIYIIVLNKTQKLDVKVKENKKRKKLFNIDLAVFVVSLIGFVINLILTGGSSKDGIETTFVMLLLGICLFTFQMLLVLNSEMFKKLIGTERTQSNETN